MSKVKVDVMIEKICKDHKITKAVLGRRIKEIQSSLINKEEKKRYAVIHSIYTNSRQLNDDIIVEASVVKVSKSIEASVVETSDVEASVVETSGVEVTVADVPISSNEAIMKFKLTNLVCGLFQNESIEVARCGVKAHTIAENLVRVAATRIFADPSQSVIEILTNSIDSYRRLRALNSNSPMPQSIGKFGMGFMSIMWWVYVKFPHRILNDIKLSYSTLSIVSYTPSDGVFLAVIYRNGDELECNVIGSPSDTVLQEYEIITPYYHRTHGTRIQLRVWDCPFEAQDMFNDQIDKVERILDISFERLRYNKSPNRDAKELEKIVKSNGIIDDTIIITEKSTRSNNLFTLCIDDFAEGIPKAILGSLLAPSLSTKTLTSKDSATYPIGRSHIELDRMWGGIVIVVGGIEVVNPRMIGNPDPQFKSTRSRFVVNLPLSTQLPVSRDDIIITPTNYEMMVKSLRTIVDLITHAPSFSLDFLLKSLKAYAEYSGQPDVWNIIKDVIGYISMAEQDDSFIFVPNETVAKVLKDDYGCTKKVVVYSSLSLGLSTKRVNDAISESGYDGWNVVNGVRIVPTKFVDTPTLLGLPTIVFFPRDQEVSTITSSLPRMILSSGETKVWNTIISTRWGGFMDVVVRMLVGNDSSVNDFNTAVRECKVELGPILDVLMSAVCTFVSSLSQSKTMVCEIPTYYGGLTNFTDPGTRMLIVFKSVSEALNLVGLCSTKEFMKEYINLLIAFFTTTTNDVPYGSTLYTVFPAGIHTNLFVDDITESYLPGIPSMLYVNNPFFREDLFVGNMMASYRSLNRGVPTSVTFAFVNGIHFQDFTMKRLMNRVEGRYRKRFEDMCVSISRKCKTGFEGSIVAIAFHRSLENLLGETVDDWVDSVLGISTSSITLDYDNVIDVVFGEVRAKYSVGYMNEWMNTTPVYSTYVDYLSRYNTTFFDPMTRLIRILTTSSHSNSPSQSLQFSKSHIATITANQLIDYVFAMKSSIDIDTHESLFEFVKTVSTHLTTLNRFQLVQIAANEGTSKPFVESVLTELLQNAMDAMRVKRSSGSVMIGVSPESMSVEDGVGIPASAYLSLWIPFLSSKSKSSLTTGEMGTGLFNIYRQPWCKRVEIVSLDVCVIATPILDSQTGRVLDIEYAVFSLEDTYYGTRITVFLHEDGSDNVGIVMDAMMYANSTLSMVSIPIYLNGRMITHNKEIAYSSQEGTVYTMDPKEQYPSILLTNGVPMGSLTPLLESFFGKIDNEDVLYGIVVDVNKEWYQPTQSRNRGVVNLDMNTKNQLIRFLYVGVFMAIIKKINDDKTKSGMMNIYLPNATSTGTIEQFKGYRGSSSKKILDGKSLFGMFSRNTISNPFLSMSDIFDDLYAINDLMVTLKMSGAFDGGWPGQDLYDAWRDETTITTHTVSNIKRIIREAPVSGLTSDLQNAPEECIDVILRWMYGKKQKVKEVESTFVVSSSSSSSNLGPVTLITDEMGELIDTFVEIMSKVVSVYYTIGNEMDVDGLNFLCGPPIVEVTPNSGSFSAYYTRSTHTISFTFDYVKDTIKKCVDTWEKFESIEDVTRGCVYLRTESPMWGLIGDTTPTSTLIHELQHALFNQGHTDTDSHGDHTFAIDNKRYTQPFELSCQTVYNSVVSRGFWNKLKHST